MSEFALTFGHPPTPSARRAMGRRLFMQGKYGVGPVGKTCKDCLHLVRMNKYFKCEEYRISMSDCSDWRQKWPACGLFQETP